MALNIRSHDRPHANPVDAVEQLIVAKEWAYDRRSDFEIAAQVAGQWCDYSMFIAWNEDASVIHVSCAFDMRVPARRRAPVFELLAAVNEHVWLGHFGMWENEGLPMYRCTLPLRGTEGASVEQLEDVVETAISECEKFYPAFQFVVWAGKSAAEAVRTAMMETVGEA